MFPSFRRLPGAHDAEGGPAKTAEDRAAALREKIWREAFEAGVGEGRAAAAAEWTMRLGQVAEALERAGELLLARRAELAAELDRQLPRVILLLARKILQRELADASALVTIIQQLTERLAGWNDPVAVRLHPGSAEAFETWRRQSSGESPGISSVRVEADPGLEPGEWLLETRDGFLDGRIESQLEEAWRVVTETTA